LARWSRRPVRAGTLRKRAIVGMARGATGETAGAGDEAQAQALAECALACLSERKLAEAEELLRRSLELAFTRAAANNLAFCRYQQGDAEGALEILDQVFQGDELSPYAHALASLAHSRLGHEEEARAHVQQAIAEFEAGLRVLRNGSAESLKAWREYTVMIKRAAAALDDHRLVYDLYRRWENLHGEPEDHFLGGVAAFNLGKYRQAARIWRRVRDPHWRFVRAYVAAAEAVADGIVPPFPMEYDYGYDEEALQEDVRVVSALRKADVERAEAYVRERMQQARLRVRFLGLVLLDRGESSQRALEQLVRYGGEWGIALAKQVCKASVLPMELKVAAVDALVKLGVQPPDQPGEIVHDGKPVQIEIKRMELIMREDPELGRLTEKAMQLRDAGRREEAKEILESMLMDGQAYPPAMLALANLYRSEGDLDRAQSLLEILDRAFPDHPIVQFNLAGFWLQRGDPGRALSHFRRVDRAALPAEVQHKYDTLAAHLRGYSRYSTHPATIRNRARRKRRK